MSLPQSTEPLSLPLTFTHTAKAKAKSNATLLAEGDYDAVERRVYSEYQKCHGCGVDEKALTLIVIRDRTTGETFEIGSKCMQDLYDVSETRINEHAGTVRGTRLRLHKRLGLAGSLSSEKQIEIVREAVLTYVPVPERHTRVLDAFSPWDLTNAQADQIRDLHQLACYHREWQEDDARARARWSALSGHPAFASARNPDDVRTKCRRALESGIRLPEEEILALNALLRKAAAFKPAEARLAAPDAFHDKDSYIAALKAALKECVQLGAAVNDRLTKFGAQGEFDPRGYVSFERRSLFAVLAVPDADAARFVAVVERTQSYWTAGKPPTEIGPVEIQTIPAVTRQQRNEDNEMEEITITPAWSFRFRRVAWALPEPFTSTYSLWRTLGRPVLETYL